MDESSVAAALRDLPLGGLRFYSKIDSTNDRALAWVSEGAPDTSLVVADEQTAGRGRAGRRWRTPPGSALAFSLILRPTMLEIDAASRLSGLGSLAVTEALEEFGLAPQIKWPNDVLLGGRKAAGVLVESVWTGTQLNASVVGIGVNALLASAPPMSEVSFPATTVEGELGRPPNRLELLRAIVLALLRWRRRVTSDEFIANWQDRLAYRGQQVTLAGDGQRELTGVLVGIDSDGGLLLQIGDQQMRVPAGELTLRPPVIK